MKRANIILIGMPAAGKSTVGRLLATRLQRTFVDTDQLMEQRCGKSLAALMAEVGLTGFRAVEEQTLLEVNASDAVIATGGSAVYSEPGMRALSRQGKVIFLNCALEVLASRVGSPRARGMVIAPGQSLADLYRERLPLYMRYADLQIDYRTEAPEEVARQILAALTRRE